MENRNLHDIPIEELELNVRFLNRIKRHSLNTVGDVLELFRRTPEQRYFDLFMDTRNFEKWLRGLKAINAMTLPMQNRAEELHEIISLDLYDDRIESTFQIYEQTNSQMNKI